MLTNNKKLKGLIVRASDGEIGSIDQLYFDDQSWAIRYLTAETGTWLEERKVLISPYSILQMDWEAGRIDVSLTHKQIEQSPNINTQLPVSRQHEAEFYSYYGYPYYWEGPYLWGPLYSPNGMVALTATQEMAAPAEGIPKESLDFHLRSTEAVSGYNIEAKDGAIGHVERFIVDDETWAIRYLEVATTNFWPGKKVLISPAWVERVSWEDSKVFVAATREAIKNCPEYDDAKPINREYENKIYFHYGRPPYWIDDEKNMSAYAASSR